MLSLTEDILDLAKMQSGTFTLNEELFTIGSLVSEIEYIFDFQCARKNLYFRVDADEQMRRLSFNSDSGRLKQVLMNLISNAFKFTEQGGITVAFKIRRVFDFHLFQHCRCLEVSVKDTGVGIAKEDKKQLFKLFGTILKHREGVNKRGTGLGLSISKKIVESMRGEISVKSELGVGTEFLFYVQEKHLDEIRFEEEQKNFESCMESLFSLSSIDPIDGPIDSEELVHSYQVRTNSSHS